MPLLRPGGVLWALVSEHDAEVAVAALAGNPSFTAAHAQSGVLAVRKAVRG
jgi:hypothetical protein